MSNKRSNSEGTITLRKDGRWMARYTYNGKRVPIYGKTQKEVKTLLKQKMCNLSIEKLQELFNLKKKCPSNNDKTKTLSGRTIDGMRRVIRTALNQAKIDGYIMSDPIKGVKIGTLSKPDVRALTREKQFRLHKTAEKWQKKWPSAFAIILSMYTGMRKGEILGHR